MARLDESGYTYDMRSYCAKDSCFATDSIQLLDIWLIEMKALNTKYLWTLFYHQDFFVTTTHTK
jgi:hypothetical protein